MILSACSHEKVHRHGKNGQGHQRFKCAACGETFVDCSNRPLSNAHSKSPAHHTAMVPIFACWYNFVRVHETIKKTLAMAAGLTDRQWTIREMLERSASA